MKPAEPQLVSRDYYRLTLWYGLSHGTIYSYIYCAAFSRKILVYYAAFKLCRYTFNAFRWPTRKYPPEFPNLLPFLKMIKALIILVDRVLAKLVQLICKFTLNLANIEFCIIRILFDFYKYINAFLICQILSIDYVLDDLSANIIKFMVLAHTLYTINNIIYIYFL